MIDIATLNQIESDLGLNLRYNKGQSLPVKNCWHFTTDGNAVDAMFASDEDFRLGMNRIYTLHRLNKGVTILAFCLMDTHVHFVLHGEFSICNRFIHDYVKRTSMHIAHRYGEHNKLCNIPIRHQKIDNDRYLKNAICYTLKNPTVAGLPFVEYEYPWSSASLLLTSHHYWNSHDISDRITSSANLSRRDLRLIIQNDSVTENVRIIDGIVHPDEYVATDIVKRIFRTAKGLNYFMCSTKESDVETLNGAYSYLTIPMQEMRQHKHELCMELFGRNDVKSLSTAQRMQLARTLKSRFNSSTKQILRLCGLVNCEIKL